MGEELAAIVKRLASLGEFPVEEVILFGSHARGDPFLHSDYDLIVVSSAFASYPFPERASRILPLLPYPGKLDLLCYTPEEFARKSQQIGIVRTALEEGKRLL